MASDINTTLTSLKLEAIRSLMESMVIDYPEMKNKLYNLSQSNSSFQSLLNLYSPTFVKLSSFDINGSMLLAYLDFYTLYIILYANLGPINNLINITKNKLSYLMSIYKDTDSILIEKGLQKDNKYVFYTNFFNPKNIDLSISKVYLLKDKLSDALNSSPVLTLPVESTEDVNVLTISSTDTDSYVNTIENNNSGNDINYSINRKGFNKIGIADSVVPLKDNNTYNDIPIVTGTIHGYFSENISIVITSVDMNGSKPSSVSIIGSSDNLVWSEPTIIPVDTETSFYIDNKVDLGLSIKFSSNIIPAIGDSWKINFRYIDIDNPMLKSVIKFMSLKKVSFITWNDFTKESADFVSQRVKYRQAEKFKNITGTVFSNGINNIVPIFNNVNDYELTLQQNSYNVKPVNSELAHSFEFNISDIHCIYNEYKSYGITSFASLNIKQDSPILSIGLNANEFISEDYVYNVTNGVDTLALSKQFVEHSLMVTFDKDILFIPCLNKKQTTVNEYVVVTTEQDGTSTYTTRFPVDESVGVKVSNITTRKILTLDTDYTEETVTINQDTPVNNRKKIRINDYDLKSVYCVTYNPKVNTYTEATNYSPNFNAWMYNNRQHSSNIYYMYYKDVNSDNKIALCTRDITDTLTPFHGTVSGIIEMRSLDQGYLSPAIFEYTLLAN